KMKYLLFILLTCLGLSAADNNARIYRLKGFKGIWVPPPETLTFTNVGPITITDHTIATPYPDSITVSGVSRPVVHLSVVIDGLSHNFPDDVDILLVNPQ